MALDHDTFRKLLKARYEKELDALDTARKKRKDLDANDLKAMYQLKLISKDQYNDLAKQLRQLEADKRTEQDIPDPTLGDDLIAIVTNTVDPEMDNGRTIQNQESDTIETPVKGYKKTVSERREKPAFDEDRYTFVKEIGQGGMGKVVLRKDTKMGKDLADKTILAGRATRQHEERFKREIDITRKFEHPYIIGARDYGYDSEGNLHFLMDFVRGKEFTKIIDEICEGKTRKYPLAEVLQLFLKVVDAVDYMHERDIIHRDLKPDNIFVDDFGQVKIMDFGLAKDLKLDELIRQETARLDSNTIKRTGVFTTQQGLVMGTPAYMAPEQALDSTTVDGRADVYALGAMLYEIIVGEPPHVGKSVQNTLHKVLNEDIIEPIARAAKNYDIPRELNAIIMKALYKDTEFATEYLNDKNKKQKKYADLKKEIAKGRYRKASDFADDIRAFLSNDPVSAYKDTMADKISKFSKKKPGKFMSIAVGVPAAALLIAAIAGGYGIWQSREAVRARADLQEARAESAEKDKKILAIEKARETKRADAAETEIDGQRQADAKLLSLKSDSMLQNENYYAAALSIINEAVRESPNYWKPYLIRAKHQAEFGKHEEAERDFNQANEVFKKNSPNGKYSVEIWFEAGMFYGLPIEIGGKGEEEKALEYFKKASGDKGTFGRLAKAASLMIEGKLNPETIDDKIPEAIEITERLAEDTVAKSIDATWLVRAWILGAGVFEKTEKGKPEILAKLRQYINLQDAKEALLQVVSENKGDLNIRNFLGAIYSYLCEYDKAIDLYNKILETRKIEKYHCSRGTSYFNKGDYKKAIEDYDAAIMLNPKAAQAYTNKGSALFRLRDFNGALIQFNNAISIDSKCAAAYYGRAYLNYSKGERSKAAADCLKCLEINPFDWYALSYMGFIKSEEGQPEESLKYYKEAIKYGILAPDASRKEWQTEIARLEDELKKK